MPETSASYLLISGTISCFVPNWRFIEPKEHYVFRLSASLRRWVGEKRAYTLAVIRLSPWPRYWAISSIECPSSASHTAAECRSMCGETSGRPMEFPAALSPRFIELTGFPPHSITKEVIAAVLAVFNASNSESLTGTVARPLRFAWSKGLRSWIIRRSRSTRSQVSCKAASFRAPVPIISLMASLMWGALATSISLRTSSRVRCDSLGSGFEGRSIDGASEMSLFFFAQSRTILR